MDIADFHGGVGGQCGTAKRHEDGSEGEDPFHFSSGDNLLKFEGAQALACVNKTVVREDSYTEKRSADSFVREALSGNLRLGLDATLGWVPRGRAVRAPLHFFSRTIPIIGRIIWQ